MVDMKIQAKLLEVKTKPYMDQNPGTSGLRKKVTHFQQTNYLANFTQSIFLAHEKSEYQGKSLVLGGDGRYFSEEAIEQIIRISFANGIQTVLLADKGLMSTPAVSLQIRSEENCFGGIILTASHNPGGPKEDFGMKFNSRNGGPAPESVTNRMYESSKTLSSYYTIEAEGSLRSNIEVDLDGNTHRVKVVDSTKLYVEEMQRQFDFPLIKDLFKKNGFSFLFDGMNGVAGPYARRIFGDLFGIDSKYLLNCDSLDDFGGLHPDPNLVYAKDLVKRMNINKDNNNTERIEFGAACDGDADRNMILGWEFFVSPSDSLALIAANYKMIKCFENGIKGIARSMPTSSAADRVAQALGIPLYETPTGWKFFGNLMDAGMISICGEESFGTGSPHIREKDGIWAILAWLNILARVNQPYDKFTISLRDLTIKHWKTYGRDYYSRYDYEGLSLEHTADIIKSIESNFSYFEKLSEGNKASIFEYRDPVDKSESKNQGWILRFQNGSRIIFRKSGTSSSGATVRIYFEKYEKLNVEGELTDMIKDLSELALKLSRIHDISGRTGPTVIT